MGVTKGVYIARGFPIVAAIPPSTDLVAHLIKLVDAHDSAVSQHHCACLQTLLTWEKGDASDEPTATGGSQAT